MIYKTDLLLSSISLDFHQISLLFKIIKVNLHHAAILTGSGRMAIHTLKVEDF